MREHTEEEPPPRPTDLEGWRRAISEDRFRTFKMETVVAAIQDLGPNADKLVINPLVLTLPTLSCVSFGGMLTPTIATRAKTSLRRRTVNSSRRYSRRILRMAKGYEKHLFQESDSGQRMRSRADKEMRKRECSVENIHEVSDARLAAERNPRHELDEKMYVEHVLSNVTDERKRLAFRMHMEGIPLDSKRTASIAKALGVSSKTARQWIEEVQAQLKRIVGEQS